MDNLTLSVTKSITELLEQYEKRHSAQQISNDNYDKQTINLQAEINRFHTKYDNLIEEVKDLKLRLDNFEKRDDQWTQMVKQLNTQIECLQTRLGESEKRNEDFNASITQINSKIDKIPPRSDDSSQLMGLITILSSQVHLLDKSRNNMQEEIKNIHHQQNEIMKQIQRQHELHETNSTSYQSHAFRPPVRSPSDASYLNSNTYSPVPRQLKSNLHKSHPYETMDNNVRFSELSGHAEDLKRELDVLNDLNRSFEKSSIFSND